MTSIELPLLAHRPAARLAGTPLLQFASRGAWFFNTGEHSEMDAAGIAIWERTPYWVPELQRSLQGTAAKISACRLEQDVEERLARQYGQLVIVSHDGVRLPLRSIQNWIDRGVRCHLVLDEAQRPLRWFLHEVGATSVLDFDQARSSLVGACRWWAGLASPRTLFATT